MPDEKPPDKPDQEDEKDEKLPCAPGSFSLKPAGEVVLTHHDAPPPSGKQRIHQRRRLPEVPDKKPNDRPLDEQDHEDPNNG